jgi:hypothetical protein
MDFSASWLQRIDPINTDKQSTKELQAWKTQNRKYAKTS